MNGLKRSNFVCGLGASGALHVGLLVLLLVRMPGGTPAPPTPPKPLPIQIAEITPAEQADPPAELAEAIEQIDTPMPPLEQVAAPPPRKMPEPIELPPAEPARTPSTGRQPGWPRRRRYRPRPARRRHRRARGRSRPRPHRRSRRRRRNSSRRITPQSMPRANAAAAGGARRSSKTATAQPAAQVADEEQPGHPGSSTGDGDYVPPLRVHWRDAGELIAVARSLGLRLAAVNRSGAIIGEVALISRPDLKEWSGLPQAYSNRVRMLSPSIFNGVLKAGLTAGEIHEIWVFVPAHQDRVMISTQRSAVTRRGGQIEDVLSVDARFVKAANGSYRLDVTNIRWRDGRGPRD